MGFMLLLPDPSLMLSILPAETKMIYGMQFGKVMLKLMTMAGL